MRGSALLRSTALLAGAALATAGLSVVVAPAALASSNPLPYAKNSVLVASYYNYSGSGYISQIDVHDPAGSIATIAPRSDTQIFATAIDTQQNVYYSDFNEIHKVAPDGTDSVFESGGTPSGIATDADGNVYAAFQGDQSLKRFTPDGQATTLMTGLQNPWGVAVDSAGNAYVADNGYSADGQYAGYIKKVTPSGVVSTAAGPFTLPNTYYYSYQAFGLAVAPDGTLYVDPLSGDVSKVSADGQSVTPFTSGVAATAVAVDSTGQVYVDTNSGHYFRYDADGTNQTMVSTGFQSSYGLAVVSKGAQTVGVSAPTAAVHPGDTYTPTVTAGAASTTPVVSASGACSYDTGTGEVTFGHPGTCTVSADQAGDDDYADAPTATQTITVSPIAQTITFGTAPTSAESVVGNDATLSAESDGTSEPITFTRDAGSDDTCSVSGTTVTFTHAGECVVTADQPGDTDHSDGHSTLSIPVGQAATAMTLATTDTTVSASVTVPAPGAGSPSGDVQFSLGGQPIGDPVALSNGVATLAYTVPAGQAQQLSATYAGDDDFLGQSASLTRNDPTITSHVSSAGPASPSGWYRSPVTVTFDCATAGAALTAACPAPVTLRQDGAAQSVTRTIHAVDGGAATVNVSGINLDATAPVVTVPHVRNGGAYFGRQPTLTCTAVDALSGAGPCSLTQLTSDGVTTYEATSTDAAGNTTAVDGGYVTRDFYLAGATWKDGRFEVRRGGRYKIAALTARAIRPELGATSFFAAKDLYGKHHWSLPWKATGLGKGSTTTLRITVGSTTQRIPIRIVG